MRFAPGRRPAWDGRGRACWPCKRAGAGGCVRGTALPCWVRLAFAPPGTASLSPSSQGTAPLQGERVGGTQIGVLAGGRKRRRDVRLCCGEL